MKWADTQYCRLICSYCEVANTAPHRKYDKICPLFFQNADTVNHTQIGQHHFFALSMLTLLYCTIVEGHIVGPNVT